MSLLLYSINILLFVTRKLPYYTLLIIFSPKRPSGLYRRKKIARTYGAQPSIAPPK
jgi:hypothetical protein